MMFTIHYDDLSNAHAQIDLALQHVAIDGGMPARHLGQVRKALEELRAERPWSTEAALAEAIAIALHRIERARLAGDEAAEGVARSELRNLARAWSDDQPAATADCYRA
jgi:hypothetical protein